MAAAASWISSTPASTGADAPGTSDPPPAPLSASSPARSAVLGTEGSGSTDAPSSQPTLDSIASSGKGSGYSAFLCTPTTPIMTNSFVDSPADAPAAFASFHSNSFAARPSSLSSMTIPPTQQSTDRAPVDDIRRCFDAAAQGKKRPSPLSLSESNAEVDAPLTSKSTESAHSSLSNELEQLRRSVHQNLRDRPLGFTVEDSDSELGEPGSSSIGSLDDDRSISPAAALALMHTSPQLVVADTRPLDAYLASHLPRAVHVSIPSLVYNRLRRQLNGSDPGTGTATAWSSLATYVSTPEGRAVWNGVDVGSHLDVIVVGADRYDEDATGALANVLRHIVSTGVVRVLRGGWAAAVPLAQAEGLAIAGEPSREIRHDNDATPPALAPTLRSPNGESGATTPMLLSPAHDLPASAFTGGAPAPSQMVKRAGSDSSTISTSSSSSVGGGANAKVGPSLSPMRRSLPVLSLNVGAPSQQRRPPPKLSLHVGQPNASLGAGGLAKKGMNLRSPKPGRLTLDIGGSSRLNIPTGPMSAMQTRGGPTGLTPTQPPLMSTSAGLMPPAGEPWQQNHDLRSPGLPPGQPFSGGAYSSGMPVPALLRQAPIEVSTILPSFLYLGPEISTRSDVDTLLELGIRRVLNVALECDDDEGLGLRQSFERYYRIPMKDSVEESGVGQGIRDACEILDDARLHDAPVYVHCKAGKSRSVTVVLAYLIHANAWTLKTSYAYVAERRQGISPNIGFVAELIQFEETELGNKAKDRNEAESEQHHATHAIPVDPPPKPKPGPRYTRESLPPEWGSERDGPASQAEARTLGGLGPISAEPEHTPEGSANRRQKQSAADIEVRKNGQWVHGRRAPVDRTTLQPGRRVSKAGLESMVMRPLEPAARNSP